MLNLENPSLAEKSIATISIDFEDWIRRNVPEGADAIIARHRQVVVSSLVGALGEASLVARNYSNGLANTTVASDEMRDLRDAKVKTAKTLSQVYLAFARALYRRR